MSSPSRKARCTLTCMCIYYFRSCIGGRRFERPSQEVGDRNGGSPWLFKCVYVCVLHVLVVLVQIARDGGRGYYLLGHKKCALSLSPVDIRSFRAGVHLTCVCLCVSEGMNLWQLILITWEWVGLRNTLRGRAGRCGQGDREGMSVGVPIGRLAAWPWTSEKRFVASLSVLNMRSCNIGNGMIFISEFTFGG